MIYMRYPFFCRQKRILTRCIIIPSSAQKLLRIRVLSYLVPALDITEEIICKEELYTDKPIGI